MHRIIAIVAVAALAVSACASADGVDGAAESLPVDDQTRTVPGDDTPIPVEPDGGIGDGATGEGLPVVSPDLAAEVDLAVSDLMERLGGERLIEVVVAHELTWPDASLGCPEPDMSYTQALVEGYRIELADGATTYTYHGELGRDPFLCE